MLGSAGSNRIRSAILQVIVGVVDRGLGARDAVLAPRAALRGRPRLRRARASTPTRCGRPAAQLARLPRPQPVLRRRAGRRARPRDRRALGRRRPAARRRRGGGVTRAAAVALAALAALALGACGSEARDLFLVDPQRRRPRRPADAAHHRRRPRLVQRQAARRHHERAAHRGAREPSATWQDPAKAHLRLAPGPQSVFSYHVRTEDGGVDVERRLGPPAAGALQARKAHARRGARGVSPGALAPGRVRRPTLSFPVFVQSAARAAAASRPVSPSTADPR